MSSSVLKNSSIPVIREMSFGDHAAIAELERERGLTTKNLDEWKRLWTENPAYCSLHQHWPIGWVLEHKQRIVGAFGNIPLLYEWNGRSLLATSGRGWVTNPLYGGYAPLLLHELFTQPNVDLCLSTTASPEASQILEAMGALQVPVGSWDKRELWILNYRAFSKVWLSQRRLPVAFSYILAPALVAKGAFAKKTINVKGSEVKVERCAGFDERFDEFWRSLRAQKPDSLLAVRTRPVLEWHFQRPLLENKLWILTVCHQERLAAYAVFLQQESSAFDVSQLLLADFQALDDQDELIYPILRAALEESRKENIYLLEKIGLCIGSRNVNMAPYVRRRACWSFYYKSPNHNLARLLTRPSAWAPSLLDGDSTL
jgi:hypothetical protein